MVCVVLPKASSPDEDELGSCGRAAAEACRRFNRLAFSSVLLLMIYGKEPQQDGLVLSQRCDFYLVIKSLLYSFISQLQRTGVTSK
jgi:hypothetical protein